jgi:hypothetical protein
MLPLWLAWMPQKPVWVSLTVADVAGGACDVDNTSQTAVVVNAMANPEVVVAVTVTLAPTVVPVGAAPNVIVWLALATVYVRVT